ncbi:hypothetical protein INT47_008926 [Mucor saturninus]|uniref:Nitrogen regulatory protein areA GATA-like domain-containing protein n=1 Tax=Mucor saturninus TaxID=64648 RepID=A0A8H7R1S0_9FUNG|nr:hypothetical protein INT47_008926 [Mucor saturninus]
MTTLLSDMHLPMLIQTTLSESPYKSVPWNNLDQLSCLWGVFTKCKNNIRDGFRLENLSWRLWYRQSVLQKKAEPKTCELDFSSREKSLHRTKSLPDLSQWSHQKKSFKRPSQKFFITVDQEESESEEEEEEEEEPMEEVSLTFTKITTNALSKPVSLLSDMLVENNSGLRRCQSRYSRLDQFFLEATTA